MNRNGILHLSNQQVAFASDTNRMALPANLVLSLTFQEIGALDSHHRHATLLEVTLKTGLSHQFIGLRESDRAVCQEMAEAFNVPLKTGVVSYGGQNWGQLTVDAQRLLLALDAPESSEFSGAPVLDLPVSQVLSATMNGSELLVQFRPEPAVSQACRIVSATFVSSDHSRRTETVRRELCRFAKIGDEHSQTAVTFHDMSLLQPTGDYDISLTGTGLLAERFNDDGTTHDELNIQYTDIEAVVKLVEYENVEASVICVCQLRPSCTVLTGPNAGFLLIRFTDVGTPVTLPVRGRPTRTRVMKGDDRHREQVDVFKIAGLQTVQQEFDREAAEDEGLDMPEGANSISVDVVSDEGHEIFTKLLLAFNSTIRVQTFPPTLLPAAEPEPGKAYTTAVACNHNGREGVLYFGQRFVLFLHRPTLLIDYREIEKLVINQRSSTDSSLFGIIFQLRPAEGRPRHSVLQTKSLRIEFGHLLTSEDLPRLQAVAKHVGMRVEHLRSEDIIALDRIAGSVPDDEEDEEFNVEDFNAEHASSMAEDEQDDQVSADEEESDLSDGERRVSRKPRAGQTRAPKVSAEELGHRLDRFGLDLSDE